MPTIPTLARFFSLALALTLLAPNALADSTRFGQSGVRNTQSAKVRKAMLHFGVQGRGSYYTDFINEAEEDSNLLFAGNLWASLALFEILELSISGQAGSNANAVDGTRSSLGDLYGSLKIAYSLGVVAFGADARFGLPTAELAAGYRYEDFNLAGTGLFTLDLSKDGEGFPFRAHLNGGYVYRNNKADKAILNQGLAGHYLTLATNTWFYDHITYGLALEFPLGIVTPYVDVSGGYALTNPGGGANGEDYAFTDSALVASPGIKIHPFSGFTIDLGVDVGALGNAGFLEPKQSQAVPGQPIQTLWTAYAGISYSFLSFGDKPAAKAKAPPPIVLPAPGNGLVKGCVKDAQGEPIKDAVVDLGDAGISKLLTNDEGCYTSYALELGKRTVSVSHPRYASANKEVDVQEGAGPTDFVLESNNAMAQFSGSVKTNKDEAAKVTLVVTRDDEVVKSEEVEGDFDFELPSGSYQVLLQSEEYLAQGAVIELLPEQKLTREFVVKPIPKKRLSTVEKGKINLAIKIPFASGKATLLKAAEFILDEVVDRILANNTIKKVSIEGHTDNQGEAGYNKELSEARAQAVFDYLVDKGVPKSRLSAAGFGQTKPIAKNTTDAGRAKNRRVEFVIVGDE